MATKNARGGRSSLAVLFLCTLLLSLESVHGARKSLRGASKGRRPPPIRYEMAPPQGVGACTIRKNVTEMLGSGVAEALTHKLREEVEVELHGISENVTDMVVSSMLETLTYTFRGEIENKLQDLTEQLMKALANQMRCFEDEVQKIKEGAACEKKKEPLKKEEEKEEEEDSFLPEYEEEVSRPTCNSVECRKISSKMLDLIDHSAKPCDDFYQFACGGVEKDVHLSPEDQTFDADRRIREKIETLDPGNPTMGQARTFYEACLGWEKEEERKEALGYAKEVVRSVGWFLPLNSSVEESLLLIPSPTNLTHTLATFMKSNFAPAFDVTLQVNPSNSKKFNLRLALPVGNSELSQSVDHVACLKDFEENVKRIRRESGGPLDLNEEYENYRKCRVTKGLDEKLARMERAVNTLDLLGHVSASEDREALLERTQQEAKGLLGSVLQVLPSKAEVERAMQDKEYLVHKAKDLGGVIGDWIHWEELFSYLTERELDPEQEIFVYNQKEVAQVLEILGNEWTRNSETLHNILMLLWSDFVYSSLVSPVSPPKNFCLKAAKVLLPDLVSSLYLHSFPDVQRTRLQSNVQRKVKEVEEHLLSSMTGATEEQREQIRFKVAGVEVNVGAFHDASSRNDSLMSGIQGMTLNSSHAYNFDFLLKRYRRLLYGLLQETTDSPRAMWLHGVVPYATDGVYIHETNSIYLPLATLQPPNLYFRKRLPDYIFYSGLGHLISVQFLHTLDATGVKFNGHAKADLDVPRDFVISSECLSEQLGQEFTQEDDSTIAKYRISQRNFKLNDLLSSSGATHLAWMTYLKNTDSPTEYLSDPTKSPEDHLIWLGKFPLEPIKAYFLRIAQRQCSPSSDFELTRIMESPDLTPRQRVNLVMRNEPLFASAFECHSNTPMNPGVKCPFGPLSSTQS